MLAAVMWHTLLIIQEVWAEKSKGPLEKGLKDFLPGEQEGTDNNTDKI